MGTEQLSWCGECVKCFVVVNLTPSCSVTLSVDALERASLSPRNPEIRGCHLRENRPAKQREVATIRNWNTYSFPMGVTAEDNPPHNPWLGSKWFPKPFQVQSLWGYVWCIKHLFYLRGCVNYKLALLSFPSSLIPRLCHQWIYHPYVPIITQTTGVGQLLSSWKTRKAKVDCFSTFPSKKTLLKNKNKKRAHFNCIHSPNTPWIKQMISTNMRRNLSQASKCAHVDSFQFRS